MTLSLNSFYFVGVCLVSGEYYTVKPRSLSKACCISCVVGFSNSCEHSTYCLKTGQVSDIFGSFSVIVCSHLLQR